MPLSLELVNMLPYHGKRDLADVVKAVDLEMERLSQIT